MHILYEATLFVSFTPATLFLVQHALAVWVCLVLAVVCVTRALARASNSSAWETGFTHWFNVAKFFTSLLGLLVINACRTVGVYTGWTHNTVLVLLLVNILEAILQDVINGYTHNAIAGVLLVTAMPYTLSTHAMHALNTKTANTNQFVFPLSIEWVLLYTTWNSAFSYGNNFSHLTRLVLVPPIVLGLALGDMELWLGARVLLLTFIMMLRVIQPCWPFQPGASKLTPIPGSIHHDHARCSRWGRVNVIAVGAWMLFSAKPKPS